MKMHTLVYLVILWANQIAGLSTTRPNDPSKAYLFNESSTFTIPDTASRLRILLVGGGGYGCRGNTLNKAGLAGQLKVVIIDNIQSRNATFPVRVGKGGKFPTSHAAATDETYKESSFGDYKIEGGKDCYNAPSYSTNTRCLEHFRIHRVTTDKVVKNINISTCVSTPSVLRSGENGVLIGGKGPSAMPGKNNRSSPGGHGYGAGGGSGGEHELPDDVCSTVDGGDGAPGVVYIEVVPRVCRRPVSVIFAIGYATNKSFSSQKKTIQDIIRLMPRRKVGVITFRDKAFLKVGLEEHNDNDNLLSLIAGLQNADSTESVNLTSVYAKAVSAFREEEVFRMNEYPKVTYFKTLVIFTHNWQDNFSRTRLLMLKRQLKSLGVKIVLIGLDEDQTESDLIAMINDEDHAYTSKGDDYDQVLPEREPYIIDTICREQLVIQNSSRTPTTSMTSSRSRVPPIFTNPSQKNPGELLQKEFEFLLNYDMQNVDIKNTTEIKRVMNIADELIQQSHRIPNNTKTAPGLKVIQFLEDFGLQMASTMDPLADGDSVSRAFHTKYLGLTLSTVSLMSTTSIGLSDSLMKGHVTLPKDAFKGRGRGTVVILSSNPVSSMKKENGTGIISQLMSISISPKSPGVFKKPVQLTFDLNQGLLDGERPSCEFWEHKKREEFPHGFWSSEGCTLASKNDTSVTCHCNHLTSFAVLTRVNPDSKPSSHHMRYLTIITYVGCSLSMLGCLLTIIVHAVLPSLRTERAFIHVNLVVAILLAQGFFFISALLKGPRVICFLAAVALYFFYLSVFTWMLVEGLHIYCLVIRVFHSGHERKRLYTAIGWLLPLIITVICASAFRGDFVSTELCWLSVKSGAIWAFVGPAIAIIVVNLVILILVLRVTAGVMVKDDIQSRSNRSLVRACITLLPILGLTWMFGILAFSNRIVAFEYLFCIFNSLQGLFIFLFYCVGSSEVRRECRRKLHNYETKRSLRTSQNTSGYSKSKPTNSSKLSRNSEMTGKDKYQSSYENTLL